MEFVHLVGAEAVGHAAQKIQSSADTISSAASTFDAAIDSFRSACIELAAVSSDLRPVLEEILAGLNRSPPLAPLCPLPHPARRLLHRAGPLHAHFDPDITDPPAPALPQLCDECRVPIIRPAPYYRRADPDDPKLRPICSHRCVIGG